MERHFTYNIKKEQEGKKIYTFLLEHGYSSRNITNLKKIPRSILKNGQWAYVKEELRSGDTLEVFVLEEESSPNIVPTPMQLHIVYEDEDIIVLNKPAGIPVHPSQNHFEDTLANGVMEYFASQNTPYVFRCVNRLDRDTSGLVLLAKHMISGAVLSEMVKKREIKREYLALVSGNTLDTGVVDMPIGRAEGSTIERQIDYAGGKRAVTHYEKLDYDETKQVSKLLLWLETGRTHQIRVHMKAVGHPLLGDDLYWPQQHVDTVWKGMMYRQALHSYRLTFRHPITEQKMQFMAEEPDDFVL